MNTSEPTYQVVWTIPDQPDHHAGTTGLDREAAIYRADDLGQIGFRANVYAGTVGRKGIRLIYSAPASLYPNEFADYRILRPRRARAITEELRLPGELWPLLETLGDFKRAAEIARSLGDSIGDAELNAGFLAAAPVRQVRR